MDGPLTPILTTASPAMNRARPDALKARIVVGLCVGVSLRWPNDHPKCGVSKTFFGRHINALPLMPSHCPSLLACW